MTIKQQIEKLEPIDKSRLIKSFVSSGEKERIDITYYFNKESGHFFASVIFGKLAQGPPGYAHGGAIASVLDESMGTAAWINGFKVMTATLKVNYYSSVKLDEQLFVETWVDHIEGKKVWMKGKLISENETKLYSESTGLFIILNNEKIKSLETNIKKHTIDDIFK